MFSTENKFKPRYTLILKSTLIILGQLLGYRIFLNCKSCSENIFPSSYFPYHLQNQRWNRFWEKKCFQTLPPGFTVSPNKLLSHFFTVRGSFMENILIFTPEITARFKWGNDKEVCVRSITVTTSENSYTRTCIRIWLIKTCEEYFFVEKF